MKKKLNLEIKIESTNLDNENILLSNYENIDIEKNELFKRILSFETVFLYINPSKEKSQIFFRTLFSLINELSQKDKTHYYTLYIKYPIYSKVVNNNIKKKYQKLYKNHPIDFYTESFVFFNGYLNNNLKNSGSKFLKNKNYFKDLIKFSPNSFKDIEERVFYDCNYPKNIPGFKIEELTDDIYKYVKIEKEIPNIFKIDKKNRVHYLKWHITNDLSIRYFFTFEDRKNFEKKYFFKSHSKKIYIPLKKDEAEYMIKELKSSSVIEIIGLLVDNIYKKIIVKEDKLSIE